MFSWKLFHSLRWRLQAWHGLILLLAIAGFGGMLHWELTKSHWDRIDEELLGAARILEGSMNAVPGPILEALSKDIISRPGPRRRPPPSGDRPFRDPPRNPGPFGPPQLSPGQPRPGVQWEFSKGLIVDRPDMTPEEWEASFELPQQLPDQLGRAEGPAFFVIWRADGSTLMQSKLPESGPVPNLQIANAVDRNRYARQLRGPFREIFVRGPHRTLICVGRPILGDQARMTTMTWTMIVTGITVMCIGLVGGWWSSKRAIEPIERMGQTAQRISGHSLSERVELAGFDAELKSLGLALNTMLDRLSRSFEQQRQFTADASHELRTPLAVMLAASELALSKPRTAEEYREQLVKCQRAASRMRELGDSMLTLARLDANPVLEMQPFELASLVEDAVDTIRPLAEEKSVRIELELESCKLPGNRSMLRQAIDNLLSNAIKYNVVDGTVSVRVKRSEERVTIEVTDTGVGIPAAAIPLLFDRFYRVDESRSRTAGGSGLGLSIAKRIVECHQGTLSVTSNLGSGSTFLIELQPAEKVPDPPT